MKVCHTEYVLLCIKQQSIEIKSQTLNEVYNIIYTLRLQFYTQNSRGRCHWLGNTIFCYIWSKKYPELWYKVKWNYLYLFKLPLQYAMHLCQSVFFLLGGIIWCNMQSATSERFITVASAAQRTNPRVPISLLKFIHKI